MTNNLPRRIRQHNREIAGGARATARGAPHWRVALALRGFRTQREALQAEWRLKHPQRGRRLRGGVDRVAEGLIAILLAPEARWTSRAPRTIGATPLTLCGDARLVGRIEDSVPVALHRSMRFRCGDAVRLWADAPVAPGRQTF